TAWPTGASRDEDIIVDDLLAGQTLALQRLQMLNEITNCKICWVALSVVSIFLAELECLNVRCRYCLTLVPEALERAMYQILMLPGESTEQDRGVVPLVFGKKVLDRFGKVFPGPKIDTHLASEPRPLFLQLAPDQFFLRSYLYQRQRR